MISPFMIPIVIFTVGPISAVLFPIARAYARRIEGGARGASALAPQSEVLARLERMEHAIDSIAVEVERVAEGQRFTTKLLSEKSTTPSVP